MFIHSESTTDPDSVRFLPGVPVLGSGTAEFPTQAAAARSPLAARVFEVEGVVAVRLDTEAVTVCKAPDRTWDTLRTPILMAITNHFGSGDPVLAEPEAAAEDETSKQIRELMETRIKPALSQTGGEAIFRSFDNGIVYLEMTGRAFALKDGIETMLRHYLPEVTAVRDHRDALPKPELETPEGQAIQAVLREEVNPAVAAHGGHITLLDVQGDTVYIRLEGGCQGCGMASVTLKQGVETAIRKVAPTITTVLDVTDHAGGTNPYFESGAGGASPF